jgi:hypothetical protein
MARPPPRRGSGVEARRSAGRGTGSEGGGLGLGPSSAGRVSADPARSTVRVTGAGGGPRFGQSVPASDSRSRCPAGNTQEVASSSRATASTTPGRIGSGSVRDRRWARLRNPRATRAEVPSGNTSHSLADRNAIGAEDPTRTASRGWPRISSSSSSSQS